MGRRPSRRTKRSWTFLCRTHRTRRRLPQRRQMSPTRSSSSALSLLSSSVCSSPAFSSTSERADYHRHCELERPLTTKADLHSYPRHEPPRFCHGLLPCFLLYLTALLPACCLTERKRETTKRPILLRYSDLLASETL